MTRANNDQFENSLQWAGGNVPNSIYSTIQIAHLLLLVLSTAVGGIRPMLQKMQQAIFAEAHRIRYMPRLLVFGRN